MADEKSLSMKKDSAIRGYIYPTMDRYLDLLNYVKKARTEEEIDNAVESFRNSEKNRLGII